MATTNVHIIGVGYDPQPIINILRSSLPCDRVHLLWNADPKIAASKEKIVNTLVSNGFQPEDVMAEEVDVFDYQKVLNYIMLISQIEKNRAIDTNTRVQFYLNITHGTRLVTGALCTAAMMIGAQMYYLKERDDDTNNLSINDLIIRIPTPKVPDLDKLTDKRRKFLKMICNESDGLTVSELAEEFSTKQNVNQFVGYFESNNLVERVHEGKSVRIRPTELGRMAANWLI
ncbi:HFX_2341 family transcriptional regulator domain-containing protein [Methanomethylophilus alvi]|uniref:HFX_2341 family transcriptional regulator domain-containing protein n=1 Tax=Methanomethylophilus alvi TaxID=1291540 RepID=UPI0037DD994F